MQQHRRERCRSMPFRALLPQQALTFKTPSTSGPLRLRCFMCEKKTNLTRSREEWEEWKTQYANTPRHHYIILLFQTAAITHLQRESLSSTIVSVSTTLKQVVCSASSSSRQPLSQNTYRLNKYLEGKLTTITSSHRLLSQNFISPSSLAERHGSVTHR